MATPRSISNPRQSEARRLQREIDNLTVTISLQLRRKASVDESVREITGHITRKKEQMKAVVPTPKELTKLEMRLEVLEHQLQLDTEQLHKELRTNEGLRTQITEFRREKAQLQEYFHDKHERSLEMSQKAQTLRLKNLSFEQSESDLKLELLTLREKSTKRHFDLESKAMEAQTERKISKRRQKRLSMFQLFDQVVYQDSIIVLKALNSSWTDRVKQQKQALEGYNQTIKVLTDSLEEIRKATGLGDLRDIVTAVVKSYEQERMMIEQLSKVTADADFLQDTLAALRARTLASQEGHRTVLMSQTNRLSSLKQELDKLSAMYHTHVRANTHLTQSLQAVFPQVLQLLSLFQTYQLPPNFQFPVLQPFQNQAELVTLVCALEVGINYLLTYLGAGPLTSTDLSPKSFQYSLKINPPSHTTETRNSEDPEETPLSEAEFRRRAIQRVPIPKLW